MHAKDFRGPDYYTGKTVLVVGNGGSAQDMSLLLVKHGAKKVLNSIRGNLSGPITLLEDNGTLTVHTDYGAGAMASGEAVNHKLLNYEIMNYDTARANSSISAMRPPCYYLLRGNSHTRGYIWKFSVDSLQSCGPCGAAGHYPWPEPCTAPPFSKWLFQK